jgi:hypothetical protein
MKIGLHGCYVVVNLDPLPVAPTSPYIVGQVSESNPGLVTYYMLVYPMGPILAYLFI